MKKKNVFLDTSIYISKNFNFKNDVFKSVIKLSQRDYVQLYTTSITHNEILSNIDKRVEEARPFVNKIINNSPILRNVDAFKAVFNKEHINASAEIIKSSYTKFIDMVKVETLSVSNVNIEKLFNQYFDASPPFSKKKKDEFPDAFVLTTLANWCEEKQEELYIISKDKDMEDFCEKNSKLIYQESLEKFLDIIASDDTFCYRHVKNVYSHNEAKIEKFITNEVIMEHFDIKDLYGHVNSIAIQAIELPEEPLITRIDSENATLNFELEFNYEANIAILDEGLSVYDSEDATWIYTEFRDSTVDGTLTLPIELEICDLDFKNGDLDIENSSLKVKKINNNQTIFIEAYQEEYR